MLTESEPVVAEPFLYLGNIDDAGEDSEEADIHIQGLINSLPVDLPEVWL